ncbi:MAG: HEPN domain-containing protein [Ignavibacteriaceae bacterium]|nr:HEPN domain-containing protein [Ignavibacteriaceae bacterium]
MFSLDTIRELTVYAMEQDQPNTTSMIFPPDSLKDLFRQSVGNINLTNEQILQRLQDILQDLKERHLGYRLPPHEPVMEKVLDEVNFQLESTMVHVYTMVPVQGLEVKMLYDTEIKITDDINVRKIANWEWKRYFHMLDVGSNNLPSIAFEWTRNVHLDDIQKHFNDDSHIDNILKDARLLATVLQLQAPIGMAFPWVIQYVPHCQYIGNVGKILISSFPGKPSDRPSLQVYNEENIIYGNNLERSINNCDSELQIRLGVALRRFHDGINKLNYQDRLLDQWIVVESLFGRDKDKSRNFACRLVCFLFDKKEDRRNAFIWTMNQWYQTRCNIVHGTYQGDFYKDYSMALMTQEVVRRAIIKMVESSVSYKAILLQINKLTAETTLPRNEELDEIGCNDDQNIEMNSILERYDSGNISIDK